MQQGPFDPNGWGAVTGQPQQQPGLLAPPQAQGYGPPGINTAPVPPGQSWFWSWAQVAGPPTDDDREKAFYAHLFPAIASLLCLGVAFHVLAPLLARAMTQSKHPFLLFHVSQSFAFHGALFVANVVLAVVFYVIGILTCGIGFLLHIINLAIPLVSAGFGFYLAFRARDGQWDKYPVAGEKVWAMNKPIIS